MRDLKPNVLIFSVFQKSQSESVNQKVHAMILAEMQKSALPVIELQGRYNGVNESSILIQGFEHRETVQRLCREFNQECYLESHNDRATFLVYPNGKTESIGTLTNVSKDEAIQNGSYSFNAIADAYFITK